MHELRASSRAAVWLFASAALVGGCRDVRAPGATQLSVGPVETALHAHSRVALHVAAPPVELTASDGQGLKLVSLDALGVVDGPLAFTEMHFVFENPEARTREGTFRIALPQGASPSRFAMRMADGFREGEVVDKARARVAYEDALHHKRDPALLEAGAGNEFSARVFPIQPNERKEIILSYAQTLTHDTPYRVGLRGLPRVESLTVNVVAEGKRATLEKKDVAPDADFVLDSSAFPSSDAVRSGNVVVVRVKPEIPDAPDPLNHAVLLVDTSASRALDLEDEIRTVTDLTAKMPEGARVAIAAFDQDVVPMYEGDARSFGADGAAKFRARGALGASNLEAALAWAGPQAKSLGASRVVLLSDGVATAGVTEAAQIADASHALSAFGVDRVDALAFGGIRDEAALTEVVRSGLARDGVVLEGAGETNEIARRLGHATAVVPVKIADAAWTWPERLEGMQAGDERVVFAEIPVAQPVRMAVGHGETRAISTRTTVGPLVERAGAEALVKKLLAEPQTTSNVAHIVDVAVSHRVVTPYTSMVVLETEWDYQTFGINRTALRDVLAVDGGGVAWLHRSTPGPQIKDANGRVAAANPNAPSAPWGADSVANDSSGATGNMWGSAIGDSFGAGGLGLSGVGEGGGGRGEGIGLGDPSDNHAPTGRSNAPTAGGGGTGQGIGLGSISTFGHGGGTGTGAGFGSGHGPVISSHAARTPQVRQGATVVNGRLPPEVIRRIVRQNFGRFRLCYEDGLRRNSTLAGRVSVRFVIDRSGAVANAVDGGSDLPDRAVIACVANAFFGLEFPQPEGGLVTVMYPIVFSPGDGSAPPSPPQQMVPMTSNTRAPNDFARGFSRDTGAPMPPSPRPAPMPDSAQVASYTGRFAEVMTAIAHKHASTAVDIATAWDDETPGDALAMVALGEALEASGDRVGAARAYGSIVDLFANRADLRRFAGERLERVGTPEAIDLAIDTYAKAAQDRPDHPSSHRLLAFALAKRARFAEAFAALVKGVDQPYPAGRFAGVERILREDLGLIASAWIAAEPGRAAEIRAKLVKARGTEEREPSIRFVLNWESDANDVDFHIEDASGDHAYYANPSLASGGELYADVTTGYGPECFTVRAKSSDRSPEYKLYAHYYAMGPMGYGMGKVEVIDYDGHGHLTFSERPFVVMTDRAFVDLGTVAEAKTAIAAK